MTTKNTFIQSQITVSNSGIVLIGPYIKPLFNRLGLLIENEFTNKESQKKAVLLLHYITSGNVLVNYNNELALLKILCGIDPLENLQIDFELENDEINVVNSMLSSVLNKWNTLSTSTIEDFRVNFLNRVGDLTEDDKAYILLVDKKPFDVLLESLPWEYKSIKLPWMKKISLISWG
jgi:hypothetical protein